MSLNEGMTHYTDRNHARPNVDEDWQKGKEMMKDQPYITTACLKERHYLCTHHVPFIQSCQCGCHVDPPTYKEDEAVKCPDCQETMYLPGPIAELDYYQCSSCGYMIDLTPAGASTGAKLPMSDAGLERLNQALCQVKVWPERLFGYSGDPVGVVTGDGHHFVCTDCWVDHEEDDMLWWDYQFGSYKQHCFHCKKEVQWAVLGWPELFR